MMKTGFLANFNCTFGDKALPMLTHFEDIIWPAFFEASQQQHKFKGNSKKTSFFLDNVEIKKGEDEKFYLTGIIVKKTVLEVKSKYSENRIVKADESYDSAPYSIFSISLENHRMILVKNQKGSPTISNFKKLVKGVLYEYVGEFNKKNKGNELPYPSINIVEIPLKSKIEEEIMKLSKINVITFRLYPLNGDISMGSVFNSLRNKMENLGSNSSNYNINTPKNDEEVIETIKDAGDTAKVIIKGKTKNNTNITLKNESFSKQADIEINESEEVASEIGEVVSQLTDIPEFKNTSPDNKKIYEEK
ncbi:hypothetical protein P7H55_08610 [Vagococcus lutrae]|nr:hypothetical protein [Vagococcus lutrae]MDT2817899.1 hypothetical protein [Vagococcus lutrae]